MRPTFDSDATHSKAVISALPWEDIGQEILEKGFAVTGPIFSAEECSMLQGLYARDDFYRSHIHMARHGFGRGEYKYFRYPLPDPVQALREAAYPHLARIANEWASRLGLVADFPGQLADYLEGCHKEGQARPTPLILKYGVGDYNCLHQDLYGDRYFPFQMAVLLSNPGKDFDGGDFMLVENRPRMQSVGHVTQLSQGQAVIFAVNERPRQGSRGYHRVKLRHGVSEITRGERYTLGIIFHDAR
ncbi:MAG: 2OG-Fe(II) oxygenase [Alphaproteobacteria bacterium]|nr:2OG-Fe(II) oxygenase [Alphaproteobacteria bacterium]